MPADLTGIRKKQYSPEEQLGLHKLMSKRDQLIVRTFRDARAKQEAAREIKAAQADLENKQADKSLELTEKRYDIDQSHRLANLDLAKQDFASRKEESAKARPWGYAGLGVSALTGVSNWMNKRREGTLIEDLMKGNKQLISGQQEHSEWMKKFYESLGLGGQS